MKFIHKLFYFFYSLTIKQRQEHNFASIIIHTSILPFPPTSLFTSAPSLSSSFCGRHLRCCQNMELPYFKAVVAIVAFMPPYPLLQLLPSLTLQLHLQCPVLYRSTLNFKNPKQHLGMERKLQNTILQEVDDR